MNLKVVSLLALSVSSMSAMAMEIPIASLSYKSGPVAPTRRETRNCVLYADGILFKSKKVGRFDDKPVSKAIAYTSEVKNMDALIALKDAAQKGVLKKSGVAPVGGPIYTYSTIQILPADGTESTVIKQTGGIVASIASPAAAKAAAEKLAKFLDFNCKAQ